MFLQAQIINSQLQLIQILNPWQFSDRIIDFNDLFDQ